MGSVLIAIGVLFAIVAVLGATLWLDQSGRAVRIEHMARATPGLAAWLPPRTRWRAPTVVVVEGTTRAGRLGMLHAPHTGRSCVWWHLQVRRVDRRGQGGFVYIVIADRETGSFDLAGDGDRIEIEGRLARPFPTGTDLGVPFDLTGAADIEKECCGRQGGPALAQLVEAGLLDARLTRPRLETVAFEIREAVIDPEMMVTAVARVRRAGDEVVLGWTRWAPSFLVLGTVDQMRERLEAGRREVAGTLGVTVAVAGIAVAAGLVVKLVGR